MILDRMRGGCALEGMKVFIVEDSHSIRDRLIEITAEIEGAAVVGSAATQASAISGILDTRPDCVLLDYQLLDGTGIDVMRRVHPEAPGIVFVVLTNHAHPQYRRRCMEAGASWFLDKSAEFTKVKEILGGLALGSQGGSSMIAPAQEKQP
jgi:DNA-binding NarL/FixJ family response regulator